MDPEIRPGERRGAESTSPPCVPRQAGVSRRLLYRGNLARIYACRAEATGLRYVEKSSPLYMDGRGNRWRDAPGGAPRGAAGAHAAPRLGRHGHANLQNGLLSEWALLQSASPLLQATVLEVQGVAAPERRQVTWRLPRRWGSLDRWFRVLARVHDRLPYLPDLVRSMLDGVEAVQRVGFAHGDLKPGNILVDRVGTAGTWSFCVADFNAAYLEPTTRSQAMCTFEYAGPECFGDGTRRLGAGAPDIAVYRESDLWSVGIVLLEALTGEMYFWHMLRAAVPGLSADDMVSQRSRMEEWVGRVVCVARDDRTDLPAWYHAWWDHFLAARKDHAEYAAIRLHLAPFFARCFAYHPEHRGTAAGLRALFADGWKRAMQGAADQPDRPPLPEQDLRQVAGRGGEDTGSVAGISGVTAGEHGGTETGAGHPAGADREDDDTLSSPSPSPSFVEAWGLVLRPRLMGVWVSRSVIHAVRAQTAGLGVVDWAVLLPSAMQLWDRWMWRRWQATDGDPGAEYRGLAEAFPDADGLHARILAYLGLHALPRTPATSVRNALLEDAMCAWSAALHMAGSWSGSWLTMEDLLLLRFRPAALLGEVYSVLEQMVGFFGSRAFQPTATTRLARSHPSGVATAAEYRQTYDALLSPAGAQLSPFWAWPGNDLK